jgi:enoyl-CoA hydratase/carnithine racemase
MSEEVLYQKLHNGKIAVLSFNRPKQLNAVNNELINQLRRYMEQIKRDSDIGVLIIKSEIEKAFCSGIDVSYVKDLSNEEASQFFEQIAETLKALIDFPIPTIAIVQGYAFGAGADFSIACQLRIASESTKFRFPGPQFGVVLGTQRLVNEVGSSKARMLALTNQMLDAKESLQYGLIHKVVDLEDCLNVALEWAEKLLKMPRFTFEKIQEICNEHLVNENVLNSGVLAKQSILDGDFNTRFVMYVDRLKKKVK